MNKYVLYFDEINKTHLPFVGGKGANLGELAKAGFPVPSGFCITTEAYRTFLKASSEMEELLTQLDRLKPDHLNEISKLGKIIRHHLESITMPEDIKTAIIDSWKNSGEEWAYAVRSSATAEDLPTASFAGQQDTYLNVKGSDQILQRVQECWASLFTDRAIVYRAQNGFDHRSVFLSVVVQHMVFPEVSGIMFTADPVTGNRKIVSIDASYGIGEALVSGIVSADLYQVRADKLYEKQIARKDIAIYARPEGGTEKVEITGDRQTTPALSDEQAIRLAGIGRSIEEHFKSPQDIEWCLVDDQIFIVQSRPITTLYPIPAVNDDKLHLFISFGHVQMMTEAMKPLGISVLRTLIPIGKASPLAESDLLLEAGGRLYLDLTKVLEYPQLRKRIPEILLNIDEMMARTVQSFVGREDYLASIEPGKKLNLSLVNKFLPTAFAVLRNILYRDNDQAIEEMNNYIADQFQASKKRMMGSVGTDRILHSQEILSTFMPTVLSKVAPLFGPAILTYKLIESLSIKWLGDAAELANISKSPPGNVTTEMGLALGDAADVVRKYPAVIEYLKHAKNTAFIEGLRAVSGGENVLPVLLSFLERYGMRGTGEIDVTRPRWREVPTQLVPAILGHIESVKPGQHRLDFMAGKVEAEQAAERLLARLRNTPGGLFRVKRMKRLIKVHRSLIGLREHPKYLIAQNLDLIKHAILEEADNLVANGILEHREDVYWFSLQEIKEMIQTQRVDRNIITSRKEKFQRDEKLTPPRAFNSEGELILIKPGANVPPGALAGSPVSSGTVEGRARVILKLEDAKMEKGDILVARYTDPAWTMLFPLAAGLVTEVGGLMTHGAVVAREYGIPAVVGVDNATSKIVDGQKIRVDGNHGFVEIL
ncbi:MAG: phosphoenolpyruvate synthase [Firmicutes bacterium HGW-Firmicutes-15]|nr:MAG: phosphoenolpyruvate synthase [Firmicutes bacterium HGW-Firmicutes-15]